MLNLPTLIIDLLNPFAPCFYAVTTWMKAQVLLIGVILTPGKRVVTETLRVMGLSDHEQFAQYHQVLNRAAWSPMEMTPILLKLLVKTPTTCRRAASCAGKPRPSAPRCSRGVNETNSTLI